MVRQSGSPRMKFLPETEASAYLREIGKADLLGAKEERILLAHAQTGDRKAMNALVQANLRFVVSVCLKFKNRGIPLGDLINEGSLGLMKAVERFDLANEFKFISYAVWWIRQAVFLALSKQAGFMSIPPNWAMERAKIRKVEQKLVQRLGRQPRTDELEKETGLSAATLADHLEYEPNQKSACKSDCGDEGGPLDRLAQPVPDSGFHARADRYLFRKRLDEALTGLDKREEYAIRHFFGLDADSPSTLQDIATYLGVSRERARQIKDSGLSKLRKAGRSAQEWNFSGVEGLLHGFKLHAGRS